MAGLRGSLQNTISAEPPHLPTVGKGHNSYFLPEKRGCAYSCMAYGYMYGLCVCLWGNGYPSHSYMHMILTRTGTATAAGDSRRNLHYCSGCREPWRIHTLGVGTAIRPCAGAGDPHCTMVRVLGAGDASAYKLSRVWASRIASSIAATSSDEYVRDPAWSGWTSRSGVLHRNSYISC